METLLRLALTLCLGLALSCAGRLRGNSAEPDGPRVHADTVTLASGAKYVPGLRGVRFVGELSVEGSLSAIIVSGHECDGCDAPRMLLVQLSDAGPLQPIDRGSLLYEYPGRVEDADDGKPIRIVRVFFGSCYKSRPPALLQFNRAFDKFGHEARSAFGAFLESGQVVHDELEYRDSDLAYAEQQLRTGRCQEVQGIDRVESL